MSRTYLSIGDVLTLLREEFPDVTISKIRFLESQGLVNPERSPSGYRKFFEADVERLRWVLRQQREHFLPLKVIRDRLAEGDLGDDMGEPAAATVGATVSNGKTESEASIAAAAPPASSGRTGAVVAPGRAGRSEEELAKADDEAMARILADASRRAAQMPERDPERAPLQSEGAHAPTGRDAALPEGAAGASPARPSPRTEPPATRPAAPSAAEGPPAAPVGPGAR
ncbi:MAG TPA: MerR family transcriptional regulator, partial [Acidimicrobiales bacterium]|nr:MerR family transcriptional regulator [Acidimicrobiales bacterium]